MPRFTLNNTLIVVDEFKNHGDLKNCYYFLSHFHTDHYEGVTRDMTVYGSELTCELLGTKSKCKTVALRLKLPFEFAHKIIVTLFDANHCPGAVMFLFEDLVNSKTILCTGDFRYDVDNLVCKNEWPLLSGKIVKMFADTTYLSTKTTLPTQQESINYCIEQLKQHYSEGRTKIICQTYSVGKEKLFVEIAKKLKIKFYPNEKQRKATLKLIYKNQY